jgi:PAS domain S-box-containing protein
MTTSDPSHEEQRFRRLVDALDHAVVWEFDDGAQQYTFVSEHARVVLGYDAKAWMRDPQFLERRSDPTDAAKLAEALAKVRSGEANDLRLEHRCAKIDGAVVWLHTGIHLENEGGRRLLRGVTIDINNIKTAEERERAAREQAEKAISAYEELMAVVSHDLRNPLNAIMLGAAAIERDPGNAVATAATITRSAARMARLIEDLVDLSSIHAGRLAVSPTEVSTHALAQEALDGFASFAAEKGVRLTLAERGTAVLHCDPKRVAQVLSNLLGNALKFTPAGGVVSLTIDVGDLETELAVIDSGPGIAQADLPRVFERNWQARATAPQGRGLGLYIAKSIVEAHGGRIWAESAPGEGAAFRFTLPI